MLQSDSDLLKQQIGDVTAKMLDLGQVEICIWFSFSLKSSAMQTAVIQHGVQACETKLKCAQLSCTRSILWRLEMKREKEKVWWWFLLGGRVQWCSSTLWASSVFQLLQIWCLAVWTNSAKEQRKWLTKWLRLLWVLVVQPGVSPHFADSWAGQATYHLQI